MTPFVIGGIIDTVGQIADDLFTSDKERLEARIELGKLGIETRKIEADLVGKQIDVNLAEASNRNLLVSGWRPGAGWVCVAGLAYNYLVHPILCWLWSLLQARMLVPTTLPAPPPIDVESLLVLLFGLLGLGAYRTVEKVKRSTG